MSHKPSSTTRVSFLRGNADPRATYRGWLVDQSWTSLSCRSVQRFWCAHAFILDTSIQANAAAENRENEGYRPSYPDTPFPNKPSAANPRYIEELARVSYFTSNSFRLANPGQRGLSRIEIHIKAIGVWDTVGK